MTRHHTHSSPEQKPAQQIPNRCPHFKAPHARCQASFSGLPVSQERRRHLCETEDYDLCGIFLARILRQSSSLPYTASVDAAGR